MWPVPSTSWVDAWPVPTLRPRPPATAPCWSGPVRLARSRRSGSRLRLLWGRPGALSRCPGYLVLEVNRPDRSARRRRASRTRWMPRRLLEPCWPGRSPPFPRPAATWWRWCGVRGWLGPPRSRPAARPQRLQALVVTAAPELREQLRELPATKLAGTAAQLEPGPILTTTAATRLALRLLGERCAALDAELARLDAELDQLTAQAASQLRQLCGVGPEIAGALLAAAGDNPGRLHSEAAFSMLWCASDSGFLRRDGAAPPEPRWRPPSQHRPVPDRGGPPVLAPADPRLPDPADQRRLIQAGDHPVLKR